MFDTQSMLSPNSPVPLAHSEVSVHYLSQQNNLMKESLVGIWDCARARMCPRAGADGEQSPPGSDPYRSVYHRKHRPFLNPFFSRDPKASPDASSPCFAASGVKPSQPREHPAASVTCSAPPTFMLRLKTFRSRLLQPETCGQKMCSPSRPAPKASQRALLRSSVLSGDSAREVSHPVMEKQLWKMASAEPGPSLARAIAGNAISSLPEELQKTRHGEAGPQGAAFALAH